MRYEKKFTFQNRSVSELEVMIKSLPQGFRQIYPDRTINNVYYDTHTQSLFRENLDGVSPRRKVRARWYGELQQPEAAVCVEIKRKFGDVGDKLRSVPVPWDTSGTISLTKAKDILSKSEISIGPRSRVH